MPLNPFANEKAKIQKEQAIYPQSHSMLPIFRAGVLRSSGIELRVRGFPLCSLSLRASIPVKLTLENSNRLCSGPGRSHPLLSPPPDHTDTQESYLGCLMEIGGGAGGGRPVARSSQRVSRQGWGGVLLGWAVFRGAIPCRQRGWEAREGDFGDISLLL